ncbi:hypothetical protein RFI_26050 [Reticulomyxa filosa]|uniref:Uncharacterized protein n=1 Tax=Reticulomyxa filosa TaxID=46433 RepID=X6MBT1_RETFI|nr:hypothetical protein RFI_26050 [Reticulomyxa filosa]|eukprot:ETO11324.1 hypothetical protein RFI_26050 [Reticulomyxa filosa]
MELTDIKEDQMVNQNVTNSFQTLAPLPAPFCGMQYIAHKNEIIICGSYKHHKCYSYHILKNQYKLICSYPKKTKLGDHCVVKRVINNDNKDDIILLSFSGYNLFDEKHTLVMRYVSVWNTETMRGRLKTKTQRNKAMNGYP